MRKGKKVTIFGFPGSSQRPQIGPKSPCTWVKKVFLVVSIHFQVNVICYLLDYLTDYRRGLGGSNCHKMDLIWVEYTGF